MAPATRVKVVVKSDKLQPSIVRCPAGCSAVTEGLDFSVDSSSDKKRSLSAESSLVSYACEEEAQSLSKWAIGVYDKRTGEVTIRPCGASFVLHPTSKKKRVELPKDDDTKTYLEKQIDIANTFGTRKKQKMLKQRQAGVVDPNNAFAAEGLSDILNDLGEKRATAIAGSDKLLPFPKEDVDPEDAYEYEAIFGLDDDDLLEALNSQHAALKRFATERQKGSWVPEDWGAYVSSRLRGLAKNDTDGSRRLMLLRHMIAFAALPAKGSIDVVSLSREKQIPEVVLRRFIAEFADTPPSAERKQVKYTRTAEHREKLHALTVLLALRASDEFRVDVGDLAKAMDCPAKTVSVHAKHIGCAFEKIKLDGKNTKSACASLVRLPVGTLATLRKVHEKKHRGK